MSRSYWTYKRDRDNDKRDRDNDFKEIKRYSSSELLHKFHQNEDIDLPEVRYGWGKDKDAPILMRKLVKRVFLKLGNARAALKRLHDRHAKNKRSVEVTLALGDIKDISFGKTPVYAFDDDVYIEGETIVPKEQIKFVDDGTRKIKVQKYNQYERDMETLKQKVEYKKILVKRRYEAKYWIQRLIGQSDPLARTMVRDYRNELTRLEKEIKGAEEKINDINEMYKPKEEKPNVRKRRTRGAYRVHRVR